MLWKNRQVLADSSDQVGLITGYQPTMDLDADKPIYVPQYPIPFKMRQMMKDTIGAFSEGWYYYAEQKPVHWDRVWCR